MDLPDAELLGAGRCLTLKLTGPKVAARLAEEDDGVQGMTVG